MKRIAVLTSGGEALVLPESEIDPEELAAELSAAYDRGKSHASVVMTQ